MSILVTGANGKTGRKLVRMLQDQATPFVAGVRSPDASSATPQTRFDWTDRSSWGAALSGVDSVYLVKPVDGPTLGATAEAGLRTSMRAYRQGQSDARWDWTQMLYSIPRYS